MSKWSFRPWQGPQPISEHASVHGALEAVCGNEPCCAACQRPYFPRPEPGRRRLHVHQGCDATHRWPWPRQAVGLFDAASTGGSLQQELLRQPPALLPRSLIRRVATWLVVWRWWRRERACYLSKRLLSESMLRIVAAISSTERRVTSIIGQSLFEHSVFISINSSVIWRGST